MRRRILRIAIIFGLLSAFLTAISLQPAVAAGVVGDGTPASCTEAALDNALAGGGSVTFNCGLVQTSINLTATKVIANDTQIDGDGLIVLDMNDIDRHFYVAPTAILRLTDIWLEDGSTAGDGGLIRNDGTVIASNVSFRDGRALGLGGAIRNEGTLVAMGGIFTTNFSDQAGGAIFNGPSASATISGDTRLISNRSQFANGGAIANRGGTVGISGNLEFISNIAANGGGIVNALGGSVSIDGATFSRNQAVTDGGQFTTRMARSRSRARPSTTMRPSIVAGRYRREVFRQTSLPSPAAGSTSTPPASRAGRYTTNQACPLMTPSSASITLIIRAASSTTRSVQISSSLGAHSFTTTRSTVVAAFAMAGR